ncbi:MAG: FAD-binding oxidoreductase [Candidatus Pacebacteria bacterium]|nr:FAD-binding oxidoreductase [Candidatus Paceibacterota bacterium]
MKIIDDFLNKITMYKLVLYELLFLLGAAAVLGQFHVLPYSPLNLAYSTALIFAVAWIVNKIFTYFYDAPSNPESTYITALILALIISPAQTFGDWHFISLAAWAAAWAVASKYIFAIKEKHLFNPAAFGVVITGLFLNQGASWWVGTLWMLPFVAIGGFLVARKIRRFDLVFAFGAMVVVTILTLSIGEGSGALHIVQQALLYSPAVFLGTVMLTEPLTTPPTRFLRFWYGAFVGFLFAPEVHIGSFYFTPELALLAGNLFTYAVSPKVKLLLRLKDRIEIAADTYEFVFSSDRKLKFAAGQYLEWTLEHPHADGRGIRRYFTIASSPTDPDFRIGVKFYKPMSSFKKKLLSMKRGDTIVASQLAGDFTMPADKKKKLVFIAGGIGITPFRSMIEYLLAKGEKRDIVLIYSNKTVKDIAYIDLLDRAERELGIETLPVVTAQTPEIQARNEFPSMVDQRLIMSEILDYKDRIFYISGPHGMIESFSDQLRDLGIPRTHIKKDFFPGFA